MRRGKSLEGEGSHRPRKFGAKEALRREEFPQLTRRLAVEGRRHFLQFLHVVVVFAVPRELVLLPTRGVRKIVRPKTWV